MKLNLAPKLEQQQILAPQMILSMDILLLNSLDLENRIEREFMENPALELEEKRDESEKVEETTSETDREIDEIFDILDDYQRRYGGNEAPSKRYDAEADGKYEAMANHADRPITLTEHLREQVRFSDVDPVLAEICNDLAAEVDARGYLMEDLDAIARALCVPAPLAERAVAEIQRLEPRGVGARDLRECLMLQLAGHESSLEARVVSDHLEDLLHNKLPTIATALDVTIDDVKEARDLISLLNPHPGSNYSFEADGVAIPEIFVEEVEGQWKVRVAEDVLPNLKVSPALSQMMRDDGQNPQVREFVRGKIEAARWLIHAIEQRRRTVLDIAESIVSHQASFFAEGPGHLNALTMQTVADEVGVHISTVSRATNGKYIETPYGVMELRRFFTGGVERAGGGIESRDNVCELIREIVAEEDRAKPLSDSQLAEQLRERGIEIARRTVSKYRERAGVPTAKLRRVY
ncbi:MAG: RNA polymerase factor sigma-54 [Planctomycetota bacterium]